MPKKSCWVVKYQKLVARIYVGDAYNHSLLAEEINSAATKSEDLNQLYLKIIADKNVSAAEALNQIRQRVLSAAGKHPSDEPDLLSFNAGDDISVQIGA